ncbi:hypothetical protein N7533_000438 [Penicillium manginii]|jgi:hypothetical protein|uniref:uncharacterized protein n=1 Tax=Penicillium manginii TaxID=203109 RepID=UPI002548F086|nr:uncharacterized protein N7533_000438 [Penicillium manginii]KAJ5767855.1 hypothetical protein N7533_000438 [Penicillium manginii]
MATARSYGTLGANYNEKLVWIKHAELRRVNAKWIRGFIDMHLIDSHHPDQDPNIKALFRAIDAGFNTILSLKWNYTNLDFPAPGSAELAAELKVLAQLLPLVLGKVNILVIGNEPFIEAKLGQEDERLNNFYETMARNVIEFRQKHDYAIMTRLYMGALNRLDLPFKRTPAIERFLHFIAVTPELDGVDIHPHMMTFAGHQSMLEYCLARLRPEQTFLATEFTMVWHWKKHMNDTVSSKFCAKYGFTPSTKNYEIISAAMQNPWPLEQWQEYLSNEWWYMQFRGFISDAMKLYRSTGRLTVATYSFCPMRMRKAPLRQDDTPWMLNGVYAPSTVRLAEDGSRYENFPWAEEFRQVQVGG